MHILKVAAATTTKALRIARAPQMNREVGAGGVGVERGNCIGGCTLCVSLWASPKCLQAVCELIITAVAGLHRGGSGGAQGVLGFCHRWQKQKQLLLDQQQQQNYLIKQKIFLPH